MSLASFLFPQTAISPMSPSRLSNQNAGYANIDRIIGSINKYQDLQRQSRFEARFPVVPKCTTGNDGCNILADLTLRCEGLELPGRVFETFSHRTYGPFIDYPSQTSFPDITLNFICSSNRRFGTGGPGSGQSVPVPNRPDPGTGRREPPDLAPRPGNNIPSPTRAGSRPMTGMDEKVTFENWMNYINPYPGSYNRDKAVNGNVYHNFKYRDEYVADISIMCFDTEDSPSYEMYLVRAYPKMVSSVPMTWASEDVARVSVIFTYEYFRYTNMCECKTETPIVECTTADGQVRRTPVNNRPLTIPSAQSNQSPEIAAGRPFPGFTGGINPNAG